MPSIRTPLLLNEPNFIKYLALGVCLSLPVIGMAQTATTGDSIAIADPPHCCGQPCTDANTIKKCNDACAANCPEYAVTKCQNWCGAIKPSLDASATTVGL